MLAFGNVVHAAPLENGATVDLTYRRDEIKCVIRWSYDYNTAVLYRIAVWRDETTHIGTFEDNLIRPSQRDRLSIKVPVTEPGIYKFSIFMAHEYGGNLLFPDTNYNITVP
jgi:hypothetical protein